MNIAIIGLGSMGKRRMRLLGQYDETVKIYGVDSNKERASQVKDEYGIAVFASIEDACNNVYFDGAFVCTSPLSHSLIISKLIEKKINVFTEINLVDDGYEKFINVKDCKLFLSSTFLYRKDIQWITNRVKNKTVNYIYHTGQYLPDWHPWENYKDFFVGDKRTNGCREIFAIELPWIIDCFGEIKDVKVIKSKMTSLSIDYCDNYILQIEHVNGNKGLLAVDIVARKAVRRLEVYNENLHISWDGTPRSLQDYNLNTKEWDDVETYDSIVKDKNYCDNIIENAYMDEIDAFMTWISGDESKVRYSFFDDIKILKIIDKIENI